MVKAIIYKYTNNKDFFQWVGGISNIRLSVEPVSLAADQFAPRSLWREPGKPRQIAAGDSAGSYSVGQRLRAVGQAPPPTFSAAASAPTMPGRW